MKKSIKFLFVSFLFLLSLKLPAQTSIKENEDNSSAPSIDGKIDDAEWRGAIVFNKFYITNPKTDEKYYDSTVVYIKPMHDAIYFGFKFWPRGKVISKSFTRDQSTDEENEFFILLDLENKNQNGYFFAFSYLNNQRDALIYNQRNMSFEWDWVWENKSTIYREAKDGKPGYIESEIKIPVDKLQNKNPKQFGVDIQLFAYKPDGTHYFYSIVPNSEVTTLKGTYKIDLIQPFDEKLNLGFNLAPYVVADQFNFKKFGATLGGDANVTLDKNKLKATVNTDQSTLEADPFTFTFYNRPIFLTEKRPFFSKDLDIYRTPMNLFYTRSIDSIRYGANYTYRSDKLKVGFTAVHEPKDSTGKDYIVTRPNFNFKDFNLGGLFIYTKDGRTNIREHILSLDGFYRVPDTRFRFSGQIASNLVDKTKGQLWDVYSYYESNPSGGPYYDLSYDGATKDFQSSTSFNSQIGSPNDYDEVAGDAGYGWVAGRKYLSEINWNIAYYRGRQVSSDFIYQEKYSTSLFYRLTDIINISHYLEYNRPDDKDVNGNVFRRNNFDFNNQVKFLIGRSAFYIGYEFGPYFGSHISHTYTNLDLVLFDRINMLFSYDYHTVFAVKQSIFSVNLNWRIIPKLFLRSYFQQDTYNQLALWNSLLQYEFFAGSNIYFVMNLSGSKLQNTGRYFKIGYDFNL
jgi:hypothetical protein